jgi:hypothetical protein
LVSRSRIWDSYSGLSGGGRGSLTSIRNELVLIAQGLEGEQALCSCHLALHFTHWLQHVTCSPCTYGLHLANMRPLAHAFPLNLLSLSPSTHLSRPRSDATPGCEPPPELSPAVCTHAFITPLDSEHGGTGPRAHSSQCNHITQVIAAHCRQQKAEWVLCLAPNP